VGIQVSQLLVFEISSRLLIPAAMLTLPLSAKFGSVEVLPRERLFGDPQN
jgi:hypothetical protein